MKYVSNFTVVSTVSLTENVGFRFSFRRMQALQQRSPVERFTSLMALLICVYTLWSFSFGGSASSPAPAARRLRPVPWASASSSAAAAALASGVRRQVVFDGQEVHRELPFQDDEDDDVEEDKEEEEEEGAVGDADQPQRADDAGVEKVATTGQHRNIIYD